MGPLTLLDRLGERAKIGALLDAAKGGQSAVLVISGAPGVGKTALLDHAVESAAGLRIARVAGPSRSWGSHSPGCSSCCRRCWTWPAGCRIRSGTR